MALRRSDSRRRRLVVDPSQAVSQADENGAPASSSGTNSANTQTDIRAYSFGANRRNVNKTTDLFPKRVVSYLLVVLVLLVCLGLINYGAIQAHQWRAQIGDQGVSSLAISGLGSTGSWFSSFLLIVSSLACLQIFALRKHRCDDYRGTYRLWIWMSGVLLFASLCCIVNLASIAGVAFESLTQISFVEKPWLAPAIVISLLTILAARAIYEVRRSCGSMAWMAAAWLGFAAAALLQLPAVGDLVLIEFGSEVVAGNCVLFATAALLMAHLTYVRFIFLRAHGLIKLKAKKKVAKPKTKAKVKAKAKPKTKVESKPKSKTKAKPKSSSKSKTGEAAPAKSRKKTAAKSTDKAADRTKETVTASDKKVAAKKTKSNAKSSAPKGDKKKSSQDTLKEMAAASRAKEKAQSNRGASAEVEEDFESEGIIKMSKAQRRKQRKEARNRKRAA